MSTIVIPKDASGAAIIIPTGGNPSGGVATEWFTDVVLSTMFAGNTFDRYTEVSTTWADSGGGIITVSVDHTASTIRDGIRECALQVGDLDPILTALNLVNTDVTLTRAMIESGEYWLQWKITPAAGISLSDGALFGCGMCDDDPVQTTLLGLIGGTLYEASGVLNIRASNSDVTTGSGSTVSGATVANATCVVTQWMGVEGATEYFHSRASVRDAGTSSMGDVLAKAETWVETDTAQPCLFAGYETSGTTATSDHKWRIQVGVRKNPLF